MRLLRAVRRRRKRGRRRLSSESDLLLACFESLAGPVVVTDDDGTILLASAGIETLLGFPRSDLLGENVELLLPQRPHPTHVEHRLRPRKRLVETGVELVARHRDGFEVPVNVSSGHVETETGSLVVSIWRDLCQRSPTGRGEVRVDETPKLSAIGALAAGLAHELNNALQAIYGYGALALDDAVEPEMRARIEKIMSAAARAKELASRLLGFGPELHRRRRALHLEVVVDRVLDRLRPSLSPAVELGWAPRSLSHAVQADLDQLQEVLVRLILGTRDALGGGSGTIEVEVRDVFVDDELHSDVARLPPGGYVCLELRGREREDEKSRESPKRRSTAGGLDGGPGLALARGIVELHGGAVFVSQGPKGGAWLDALFPVSAVKE